MQSVVRLERPRQHPVAVAYVAVVMAGSAVLVPLSTTVPPLQWAAELWCLTLGPLGVALLILLAATVGILAPTFAGAAAAAFPAVATVVVTAVFGLVAVLNAVVVARVRERARRQAEEDRRAGTRAGFPGRVPYVWDRLAGGGAFVLAGGLFVLLSFVAGFEFLVAGGIDVPAPEAQADLMRTVAAATWIGGLGTAVAGLVLWIVTAARGRPWLRWALPDLAIIGALDAVLITLGLQT